MRVNPVIVPPATVDYPLNPNFKIRAGNTKVIQYAKDSYITQDFGRFKDKKILITKNFIDNKLTSTHYYLSDKHDNWIKSKLKTIENNVLKVICLNKE